MAGFPGHSTPAVVFFSAWILLLCGRADCDLSGDRQALLAFLSHAPHEQRLQWDAGASPCSWVGVQCDPAGTAVYSLRLPGVGLVGPIPPATVGNLTRLRILSLRSNRLSGGLPSDFARLHFLRSLYLQDNDLSGRFPSALARLRRLSRLDLSSNSFTGALPFAINNLTHLTGLLLENNGFTGSLPSIDIPGLSYVNVSNNKLNGSIPQTLARFGASSFRGNLDLCGRPLPKRCKSFFPPPAPSPSNASGNPSKRKSESKLSTAAIVAISVGSGFILLVALLLLLLYLRRRRRSRAPKPAAARSAAFEAGPSLSKHEAGGASTAEGEQSRLVFFRGGGYSFDLEDLLRASAEVLGKGSVGTSYKAVLEEGTTVVVKRLKDVAAAQREFEAQMEVLGKISHENVVPLRAFYYSRDEKLLVLDYMAAGSLAYLLHGSRGSGRTPLDWESRMRIAVSAARGLACLHHTGGVVHGNIKSSNVLLRPDHAAALTDFGLHPLFGAAAQSGRAAGYRAPEAVEGRTVTAKSDVYSFGVLLLELLTGKAPNQASLGEEGIDLPRWVQSVVREEWTAEVFDAELMRYDNIEEEMVQLLQVAMACVAAAPEQRPDMAAAVQMVEEVNRGGETTDDGLRQSSDDHPSKGSEDRTPPERGLPATVAPP